MKFSLELSVRGEAAEPDATTAVAQAAERAGFAMLGYTDHPAPSRKWLEHGGHPTYDPFGALCFVAAITTRIRLMTYLAVLSYRNPLLLAKCVATVDRLSGGRFTLVAGTGYLSSEFAALGRGLDERNDRFDEAIDVLQQVYTGDELHFRGSDFHAVGAAQDPLPVQLPHPPIWIGGSSQVSRTRVARFGTGWAPLMTSEAFARVVRTGVLATVDDVAAAIQDLHRLLEIEGRDPDDVEVQLDGFGSTDQPGDDALTRIAELESVGVTGVVVRPPDGPTSRVVESIERFGGAVVRSPR